MIKPEYRNYSTTSIRSEQTQADISKELSKFGIQMVQHTSLPNGFSVAFQAEVEELNRPVTVRIDIPWDMKKDKEDKFGWKDRRIKYRVLYYYIKGLLTAWDNGLKTFMDIFMPHIVLPGGKTVSQDLLPKYTLAIEKGEIQEVKLLAGADENN
ncbi:hypothetical protein M0R04_13345 [Candidatus Dojkabacteria bacterium]|jgi:hypothetical protein|nr:hypothetical protein [Candidatus Dojkabacteria bacterium]